MTTSSSEGGMAAPATLAVRRVALLSAVIWLAGGALAFLLAPGPSRTVVVNLTTAGLMAIMAVGSARRGLSGDVRRAPWLYLGAAGAVAVILSVMWAGRPLGGGAELERLSALAHVLNIAAYVLIVLALLAMAGRPERGARRYVQAGLEGTVAASSWFLLVWLIGFRAVAGGLEPGLVSVSALASFVGSAAALGVIAYLGSTQSLRGPLGWIAAWAAVSVLSEAYFAYLYASGDWYAGHPHEIVTLGRLIPLAVAPWAASDRRRGAGRDLGLPQDLVVYGPVSGALVVSVVMGAAGTLVYDPVTITLFLVVGMGILMRQLFVLRELRRLSRTLEERVGRRTAALEESERRYRTVVEAQTEFVVRWLPDGTRTFVNEAYCRLFRGTAEDFVGTSFFPLVAPVDRERIRARIAALTPEHPASTGEHRVLLADGTPAGWQQWTDRAFFDDEGRVVELLSVGRDVTERRNAEEALARSEARMRAIFEQSGELLGLLSPEGLLLEVNSAALAYIDPAGYPGLGHPFWEYEWWSYSADLQEQLRGWLVRCAAGSGVEADVLHFDREGEPRRVDLRLDPIRDEDDAVVLLLARGRDVTEQRRLQEEVLEIGASERRRVGQDLHDNLGQRLTGMGFLARALHRRLEKGGLAEAAEASALSSEIALALKETRFLSRGLLPVTFDATGLVGALQDLAARTSELFGVRCSVYAHPTANELPEEIATELYHIAKEGLTNAVRHSGGTEIVVRIAPADDGVSLTVTDDGAGLEADRPSTGLGLRIMRYRSQRIGARLEVASRTEGGAQVRCLLPTAGAQRLVDVGEVTP